MAFDLDDELCTISDEYDVDLLLKDFRNIKLIDNPNKRVCTAFKLIMVDRIYDKKIIMKEIEKVERTIFKILI